MQNPYCLFPTVLNSYSCFNDFSLQKNAGQSRSAYARPRLFVDKAHVQPANHTPRWHASFILQHVTEELLDQWRAAGVRAASQSQHATHSRPVRRPKRA